MNTVANKKVQYLSLIEAGYSPAAAARSLGYSRAIGSAWAQNDAKFRARFAALRLAAANNAHNAGTELSQAIVAQSTLTLQQLAMQRLERELRTDGPDAVLAAAAIVLVSPQATPVEAPAVETNDAPADAPETYELMVTQLSVADVQRMFYEVFPIGELPAVPADTTRIRQCIEQYFDCDLAEQLQLTRRGTANILSRIASKSFPLSFQTQGPSHMPKIYLVPQPKTRA